jgi:hypothetical protein
MAIPLVVDKIDVVPEAIRDSYTERDGKFFLNAVGGNGLEVADVSKLKSALSSERRLVQERDALLKNFEGLDPVKAREAIETLSQLGDISELKSLDEKLAARERQLTDKFDSDRKKIEQKYLGERDSLSKTIESLTGQLSATMIDSAATKAINDAKGSVDLLLPIIKQSSRMRRDDKTGRVFVEIVDADGQVRDSSSAGSTSPMTIKEFVEELKNNPAYGRAFDGTGSTGGGASGAAGGGGGGSTFRISQTDARDPMKYRAAREAAAKTGRKLEIV